MFESKSNQYDRVARDDGSSNEDFPLDGIRHHRQWSYQYRNTLVLFLLLFLSLVSNGFQVLRNRELATKPDTCHSPYSMRPKCHDVWFKLTYLRRLAERYAHDLSSSHRLLGQEQHLSR